MLIKTIQRVLADGSLLDIDAIWSLFMPTTSRSDLHQMLTPMEHPVLFRPFMALHPCRTAEVLAQFGRKSDNLLLTFISLYGPYVKLNLSNAYGLTALKWRQVLIYIFYYWLFQTLITGYMRCIYHIYN